MFRLFRVRTKATVLLRFLSRLVSTPELPLGGYSQKGFTLPEILGSTARAFASSARALAFVCCHGLVVANVRREGKKKVPMEIIGTQVG
jgi:hypothetical protein